MRAAGWAEPPLLVAPPAGLEGWLSAGIAVRLATGAEGDALSRFPAGVSSAIVVTTEGRFRLAEGGQPLPAAFVSGPSSRPVVLAHAGTLCCAGVMIRPAAAAALLGAAHNRVDHFADAAEVFGAEWPLHATARGAAAPAGILEALFAWVRHRAGHPDREANRRAAERLQEDCLLGITEAARRAGCSTRQIERRFAAVFGMAPKRFQRLARAEVAMRVALAAGRCDADLAAALGYFDQSHLGRDLRELAGLTPSQVARMPQADDPSWWPLRIGAAYPAHGIRADFGEPQASKFS